MAVNRVTSENFDPFLLCLEKCDLMDAKREEFIQATATLSKPMSVFLDTLKSQVPYTFETHWDYIYNFLPTFYSKENSEKKLEMAVPVIDLSQSKNSQGAIDEEFLKTIIKIILTSPITVILKLDNCKINDRQVNIIARVVSKCYVLNLDNNLLTNKDIKILESSSFDEQGNYSSVDHTKITFNSDLWSINSKGIRQLYNLHPYSTKDFKPLPTNKENELKPAIKTVENIMRVFLKKLATLCKFYFQLKDECVDNFLPDFFKIWERRSIKLFIPMIDFAQLKNSNGAIDDGLLKEIIQIILTSPIRVILKIEDCKIDDRQATMLASVAPKCYSLNLKKNLLTNRGIKQIVAGCRSKAFPNPFSFEDNPQELVWNTGEVRNIRYQEPDEDVY